MIPKTVKYLLPVPNPSWFPATQACLPSFSTGLSRTACLAWNSSSSHHLTLVCLHSMSLSSCPSSHWGATQIPPSVHMYKTKDKQCLGLCLLLSSQMGFFSIPTGSCFCKSHFISHLGWCFHLLTGFPLYAYTLWVSLLLYFQLKHSNIFRKREFESLHFTQLKLNSYFPGSSAVKESACNAGDPSSIPGSERSTGEGTGYPL